MNNSEQAKNGFKTFLVTFGISVLVFGFFYYLIADVSTEDVSIEDSNVLGYTKTVEDSSSDTADYDDSVSGPSFNTPQDETAAADVTVDVGQEEVGSEESILDSPFGDLAAATAKSPNGDVLAGATQTSQSTVPVPDTGDISITLGIVSSMVLIAFFLYIIFMNPRKYALSKFEQDITRDLD